MEQDGIPPVNQGKRVVITPHIMSNSRCCDLSAVSCGLESSRGEPTYMLSQKQNGKCSEPEEGGGFVQDHKKSHQLTTIKKEKEKR